MIQMTNTAAQKTTTIGIHKPSVPEKLFFLTSGIIVSVPLTLFIENFALPPLETIHINPTIISALILAPLIEEFAKAYPLFYRHGETERSFITLGALAGFGFAIAEFTTYILIGASPIDRIFGLFFHTSSTSIVAYGIAQKQPLPYYLLAVFFHFSANFSALIGLFWLTGILATAITVVIAWTLYNKTTERVIN
jgi:RsiW-degrading membrane proteinase PrsW (M82 family)